MPANFKWPISVPIPLVECSQKVKKLLFYTILIKVVIHAIAISHTRVYEDKAIRRR